MATNTDFLTRTEKRVWDVLYERRGHLVEHEDMVQQVYGFCDDQIIKGLRVHVYRIKRKTGADIVTVIGRGYLLMEDQ